MRVRPAAPVVRLLVSVLAAAALAACSRDLTTPAAPVTRAPDAPSYYTYPSAIYRSHDKQNHQKDQHAPPGPEAAFPCIPEQICEWAQDKSPVHSYPQINRVRTPPAPSGHLLLRVAEERDERRSILLILTVQIGQLNQDAHPLQPGRVQGLRPNSGARGGPPLA